MPRSQPCTVCVHPQSNEVTKRILDGETLRVLTADYGLNKSALSRHKRICLHSLALTKRKEQRVRAAVISHKDEMLDLIDRTKAALDISWDSMEMHPVSIFIRELRENIKASHEISKTIDGDTVNIEIYDVSALSKCPRCGFSLPQDVVVRRDSRQEIMDESD